MAKKVSSGRRTASSRKQTEAVVEFRDRDVDAEAEGAANSLEEFDPEADYEIHALTDRDIEDDPSVIPISEDLVAAQSALESMLGGLEALSAFSARGIQGSDEAGMENILGTGIGVKLSSGGYIGELALKVFVKEKLPLSQVSREAAVPEAVDGIPTDVEVTGELWSRSFTSRFPKPVPCGVSVGYGDVGSPPIRDAGTLGCLVVLNNNRLCMLSNNHVFARENNAQIGRPIIQPGLLDGGNPQTDVVGVLEKFVPLRFGGAPNTVDAAVALTSRNHAKPQIFRRGGNLIQINPQPLGAQNNMTVIKSGRTTETTTGLVIGTNVNVRVNYSAGVGFFTGQIMIRGVNQTFSQAGDSGSLILSAGSKRPVGLLFAGGPSHTLANPIQQVMRELGIARIFA